MIGRVLVLVMMGLLALPAAGQSGAVYGPPIEPGAGVVAQPGSGVMAGLPADLTGGVNPLQVIDGAGSALPGASPGSGLSTALNIMILLTVLSLAPSIMLMTTSFVRIIIVLGLVRQAMGTQSLPPPQVIMGLALFMTLLVMSPTLERINDEAITPYRQGQIHDYEQLWDRARAPMRDFMFDQIEATGNWSSLYMVLNYRGIDTSSPEDLTEDDVDMISLVPAYMLSELKTGFLMGFRVYLPFLVIDMVIASLLISMSMMMLPPVLISLPFKVLLFVLVDGWQLVVGSLMASFRQPSEATISMLGPPDVVLAWAGHAISGLWAVVLG